MQYNVEIKHVTSTPVLVVRRRATRETLSSVVPEAIGVVWNHIRQHQINSPGRNVVTYRNGLIDLEAGVEVGTDAFAAGEVILSTTPAGLVATTTHYGPYTGLNEANEAVVRWCRDHHYTLAGPSWEVYGHWTDNPEKLRTDVCYQIK